MLRRLFLPGHIRLASFSYTCLCICKEQGSCCYVKGNIEERATQVALYLIEERTTVRAAARIFGISKSTVHMDITK